MENKEAKVEAVLEQPEKKWWQKKATIVTAAVVVVVAAAGAVVACNKDVRGKISSRFGKKGVETTPQETNAVPEQGRGQQERINNGGENRYYNNGGNNNFRQQKRFN